MPTNKSKKRYEWNLGLLYKSPSDPNIERDLSAAEEIARQFAGRFKDDPTYMTEVEKLLEALESYEIFCDAVATIKPIVYFYLVQSIDSTNPVVQANINKISQRIAALHNTILFFELNIGKIDESLQKKVFTDARFKPYAYFLKLKFAAAKHKLSESEERIMNLKNLPSHDLWVEGVERIVSNLSVTFKGKNIPLAEAQGRIANLPTKDRRILHALVGAELKKVADSAESEMNAVVLNKKIDDELRGFEKPYSQTVLGYQNEAATVENLISTVTRHFKMGHSFYKTKAKMLKLPNLSYEDRAATVGKTSKKISFEDAVETVKNAFRKASPEFAEILGRFVENGQIDVYPRKGKTGGAFCWGNHKSPTFVMLNHVDTFDSLSTLAHEMGHAIHTEFSKTQPVLYEHYTTATAEVASTFFETLVFYEVFDTLSEKDKVVALHDRIQDDIQTIFRQVACFNFELEMHNRIRSEGNLTKKSLAELMNKHMQSYLGPHFKMKPDDGYTFVSWSHLRRFFYVYSYAFGQIVSKGLYKKYKEDPAYVQEIKKFLSAGGSQSPEDIFALIGIDVRKPDFFEAALRTIEDDIRELQKLVK